VKRPRSKGSIKNRKAVVFKAAPSRRRGAGLHLSSSGGNKYLDRLLLQIRVAGIPAPEREVRFHPKRRWRFDMAWRDRLIAVEYQGGVFNRQASHSSIGGLTRDYEKFTEASLAGWRLILVTAVTVESGAAIEWITRAWEDGMETMAKD
jgi:hypothetical protein